MLALFFPRLAKMTKAPLSKIDPLLLSKTPADWTKAARVVGNAFQELLDDGLGRTGDMILFARLRALIITGRVEAKGDAKGQIHLCEVRLPKLETTRVR